MKKNKRESTTLRTGKYPTPQHQFKRSTGYSVALFSKDLASLGTSETTVLSTKSSYHQGRKRPSGPSPFFLALAKRCLTRWHPSSWAATLKPSRLAVGSVCKGASGREQLFWNPSEASRGQQHSDSFFFFFFQKRKQWLSV